MRGLIRTIFLLALLAVPSLAVERFNGQCRSDAGLVSNACTVTVYDQGTLDLSSIFVDVGLGTPKSNPFTSDSNGQLFFYAADARYDVVYTNGVPDVSTFTLADIALGTAAGGSGTVTSVALTTPAIFSVAGSPITTTGTLAITLATQADNLVWAGPASGGPLAPTFRALVAGDLPNLNLVPTGLTVSRCAEIDGSGFLSADASPCNTATGTVTSVAASVPSFLAIAGSPITTSGTLAITLATQSQNTFFAGLTSGTGTPAFRSIVAADVPVLDASKISSGTFVDARISQSSVVAHEAAFDISNQLGTLVVVRGGTNITTYLLGDVLYSSATNTLAKLAGNITTTKKFFVQTGGGATSAAPVWDVLIGGDMPATVPLTSENAQTWGDGTAASFIWGFNVSGTDTAVTFGNGIINVSTGVLQVAGNPVLAFAAPTRGDMLVANTTPVYAAVAVGTVNQLWISDGTDPSWTTAAKAHIPSTIAYEDEANVFTLGQTINDNLVVDGDADEVQGRFQANATQTANIFEVEDSAGNDYLTVLGAGGSVFTQDVFVNGSVEEIQLIVQGHSTQTADLFVVENSAGNDYLHVDGDGNIHAERELIHRPQQSVASGATIALDAGNLFLVTGTTSVTTINTCDADSNGRILIIHFNGILTVVNGNNIALADGMDMVTSATDSLSLICEGTNWIEISRTSPAVEPYGAMYISATATSAVTAGTDLHVNGTYTVSGNELEFTESAEGVLRYDGTRTRRFQVMSHASFTSSASNILLSFEFAKNGAVVVPSEIRRKIGTGSDEGAIGVVWDIELATNDTIELMIDIDTGTSTITAQRATVVITALD